VLFAFAACAACHAPAAGADARASRGVVVRVPGALRLARGLDTLSVEVDPAAGAETTVHADPGMVLGVESETRVFARGRSSTAAPARHGYFSGTTFDVGTSIWSTSVDGLPQPGEKYVAEMKLVLFETDVAPGHAWDPHAGRFVALLTRTLRQAEE
jgi:hypothetical protein